MVVSVCFAFSSLYTTALLFVFLGAALCFISVLYRKSPKSVYFLIFLVLFLLILGTVFNEQISDYLYGITENLNWIVRARVQSVIDTIFQTDHGNWYNTDRRNELANYSLKTFKENPLLGVGYYGYGYGVIGCHQEWYDMLGVFGVLGCVYGIFILIFNTRFAYKEAKTKMDKDALMISVVMLLMLGFLNPCLSKQILFFVYVVAPNISSLMQDKSYIT